MSDDNGDEFDAVVGRVRERVRPDRDERERLRRVVAALRDRTEAAVADLPVDAGAVEIVQVGSTARDTWLSGERDVDLFVCFPPDLERAELESYGLEVGHAVLPDGHEEYAEHPYVRGEYDGFAVDLVPCYAVDDATATQSAVDRTPFHTRYLAERMDAFDEGEDDAADRPIADEIRVAKRFLTGIGVYGSDLRTRGFSGYLTELLVLEYGDFRAFVEAAADWHPPVELDPGDHARESFDDPLVVIDPTDPERNVAAVCTDEAVATLQHYARELLADPRESLFDPADPDPLSAADVRERFADRGTTPIAVRFDAPEVVEDQLYPQLAKSLDGLAGELDRRGFDVLRSAAWAGEWAVLLFELEVADRPAVERHGGRPSTSATTPRGSSRRTPTTRTCTARSSTATATWSNANATIGRPRRSSTATRSSTSRWEHRSRRSWRRATTSSSTMRWPTWPTSSASNSRDT